MRISRRKVLAGGASLGALSLVGGCDGGGKVPLDDSGTTDDTGGDTGGGTPVRSAEPDPWDAPGTEDSDAFAWGVQVGDATPTGAVLSVRTTEATVTVVLVVAEGDSWVEQARQDGVPTDEVLQVVLDGLAADTAYSVAVYAADGARRSPVTRFRSAIAADTLRVVTFGATSCLGGNEPWPNLSVAAAERLDVFLLLGDTIYNDQDPDRYDLDGKWSTALSTEGLRALTSSTSVVATWDDHEVENNWSYDTAGMEETAAAALAAFRRGLPQTVGPGGTGVWRKLSWGRTLDLFVLDCRGERRDGNYISVAQMDWLKAGLTASAARFKIILNSVPITDYAVLLGNAQSQDRWSGYPAQRDEVLGHIRDGGITGVLWVSGDVHFAQVANVDPVGGIAADQWEVLPGPSGSFLNAVVDLFGGDPQFPILFAAWNWGRFTCDPGVGTVHVEFVGDDGVVIAEQTLAL
jgi:alkaline phosphatase D